MRTRTFAALVLAGGLLWPLAAHAGVSVNVNIGPPAVLLPPAPPALVVVPGTAVYYAPDVSVNLFAYRGRFYSFHEGGWFYATSHRGPWTAIAVDRVPGPVVAVPVTYYRVPPPGHARAHGGAPFCPPGQAKHGRC
jgi:hypothetical protein